MDFARIRTEVRRRIQDDGIDPDAFFADEIDEAINDGSRELADATEWLETDFLLTLDADTIYYDLSSEAPETFLCFTRAYNVETSQWLRHTTYRELDKDWYEWETNTGTPEKVFIRGLWWVGFHPTPATDGELIRIYHKAVPFDLSAETDEPAFPEVFHDALVEYAAADLLAQMREAGKALPHFGHYLELEAELASFASTRLSRSRIGVLGG